MRGLRRADVSRNHLFLLVILAECLIKNNYVNCGSLSMVVYLTERSPHEGSRVGSSRAQLGTRASYTTREGVGG